MANLIKPDLSFEISRAVRTGYSSPIFIINRADGSKYGINYMTKVLWIYDNALSNGDPNLLTAIDQVNAAFLKGDGSNLTVREVTEDSIRLINEGFTR